MGKNRGDLFEVEGMKLVLSFAGRMCEDYHKAKYYDAYDIVYGTYKDRTEIYDDDLYANDWNLKPITKELADVLYGKSSQT
jgi:hypothetical protein